MKACDNHALYGIYKAKDARFDGRFFIGISSTGIYCRPVCRARLPKEENCEFFITAAQAEQAGYRPCLLCRPELAPGASVADLTAALARNAAKLLEENCGGGQSIEELAVRLGCTDRHLRRVFTAEYNVSPVQYLQTCRLLLAKNLLTDTDLSVIDVAMSAGFGSLRRFNALFKNHYQLTPTALRKKILKEKGASSDITLSLGYRAPYRWDEILSFFAERAVPGVETVKDNQYMRTVRIINADKKYVTGWIRVGNSPEKNALSVTLSETLLPVLPQVLARVRRLFDLSCDPDAVYEALSSMNDIRPGSCVPGIRLPGCFDYFETAVRAVFGQQITVRAASTLAGRLVSKYGSPVDAGIEGLTHAFPLPDDILDLDLPVENHLGALGIIGARARTIYALAEVIKNGGIDFELCTQPEAEIEKLLLIPGIGNWTAQYIAMRAMEWTDAFPETDAGIKKALEPLSAKERLNMSQAWRPWRSYATVNLWNSLK